MNQDHLIAEIKKLGALHDSGALSDTEFDEMKHKLLAQLIEIDNSERGNEDEVKNTSKSTKNINQSDSRVQNKGVSKKQTSLKKVGIIVGALALVTIAIFAYKAFTHKSSHKAVTEFDSIPSVSEAIEVNEIEGVEEKVNEKVNTDEMYFFEGPYSVFGLEGRAKYSYKIDHDSNPVLDGKFEFDEGYYNDDGTFDGMGSGVAHITGKFNNNKQDGEWTISSVHDGISISFNDGVPNGKFEWSFFGGYGSGGCKGTFKNGKLVGDFIFQETDGEDETYLKGVFSSNGKPTGIWEEKRNGGNMRWYVMDEATAKEKGVKGSFDREYIYRENLDLTKKMLDISEYVLSKKVTKQNLEYPTYWEE